MFGDIIVIRTETTEKSPKCGTERRDKQSTLTHTPLTYEIRVGGGSGDRHGCLVNFKVAQGFDSLGLNNNIYELFGCEERV